MRCGIAEKTQECESPRSFSFQLKLFRGRRRLCVRNASLDLRPVMSEKLGGNKLFHQTAIEFRDDCEERIERSRTALTRLGAGENASEKETHDALHSAAYRDKTVHDDICIGLLGSILLERDSALKCYRDLTLLSRDNLGVVVDTLSTITLEKYHKLTDVSRNQLVWVIREMVKGGVLGADMLCWNLMRQIAGGDTSARNLWLIDYMLDIYMEYRLTWLNKYPYLIAAVIYTYLRVLEDHMGVPLAGLRQKEVTFIVSLIREHFTEVCMNQQIGLGRDFVRQLQAVSRIPEIQEIWQDLFYNPKALSPHMTGVLQLLNMRTSRKYIQSRLTPDMEKKIQFLTAQVKFGNQKRYQDWFQKQYFSTVESQTLRADIIRYIVCVIHPPNEILSSDVLPRWAVIGWLLTTCTNPVAAATAKLALFYDWLVFDPVRDNIMNIEPAILVMYHSLKTYLAITATLLDFLIRLTYEYHPPNLERFKAGVGAALKSIIEKRVLQTLDVVLDNPKLEPELRKSIKENLLVLLDGNIGHGENNVIENHIRVQEQNSQPLYNNVKACNQNSNNSQLPAVPLPPPTVTSISNNLLDSMSPVTNLKPPPSPPMPITEPDPEFSDDGDDDVVEIKPPDPPRAREKDVVEETERERVFEKIQRLPTNLRLPFEALLSQSEMKVNNRSDLLDEVLSALVEEQLDKTKREDLSEALIYLYKSELDKSILNEETNSVIENLRISPISELVSLVIDLKPTDKSLRMKNVMRVLADMVTFLPKVAYKLLIILFQRMEKDPEDWESRFEQNNYESLYKNLAQLRGLKLDTQIVQDLTLCWEHEPLAMSYVSPIVYIWYVDETDLASTGEVLHLLVSTLDASQLQDLSWKVMQEEVRFFDSETIVPALLKTLEWESWEQHCVWILVESQLRPLVQGENLLLRAEEIFPIIPQLDAKKNSEALTALLFLLRIEEPKSAGLMTTLLSRRANPKDRFVLNALTYWEVTSPKSLAESLGLVLCQSSGGTPVKRKRGGAGSRGNTSPAPIPSPTTDNVLSHIDQLRIRDEKSIVFKEDAMLAALLQVSQQFTDAQKLKYKELLALAAAAEEPDTKSGVSKRPKTHLGGPKAGNGRGTSAALSRTRSGRPLIRNSDSDSSEEEETLPPPKKAKRPRKVYSSDSD